MRSRRLSVQSEHGLIETHVDGDGVPKLPRLVILVRVRCPDRRCALQLPLKTFSGFPGDDRRLVSHARLEIALEGHGVIRLCGSTSMLMTRARRVRWFGLNAAMT